MENRYRMALRLTYEGVFRSRLNQSKALLEEFANELIIRPMVALTACERVFTAGASVWVTQQVLGAFEKTREQGLNLTEELQDLIQTLDRDVVSGASNPKRSTDPTANLFHQCLLAARADTLHEIRGLVQYLKVHEMTSGEPKEQAISDLVEKSANLGGMTPGDLGLLEEIANRKTSEAHRPPMAEEAILKARHEQMLSGAYTEQDLQRMSAESGLSVEQLREMTTPSRGPMIRDECWDNVSDETLRQLWDAKAGAAERSHD